MERPYWPFFYLIAERGLQSADFKSGLKSALRDLSFVTCLLLLPVRLALMNTRAAPTISSFVIRFVVEDASSGDETQPVYRGSIRHIQSAEEINFNAWEDAVAFVRRFVPLEETDSDKP